METIIADKENIGCWQCGYDLTIEVSFCPICESIQKPLTKNYFELLKLDICFGINSDSLNANYFSIQSQFHPDRFVSKSDYEKFLASEQSVRINEAYHTLKSPITRAGYLLKLSGVDIGEGPTAIKPDVELLEQIMLYREKLLEIDDKPDLCLFESTITDEHDNSLKTFDSNYSNGDIDQAAISYMKLKYLAKLLEEIKIKKRWME